MRVDVREQLRSAAALEREFHDTRVALIASEHVGKDWSEPLEMRIVESADGLVEIQFRKGKEAVAAA